MFDRVLKMSLTNVAVGIRDILNPHLTMRYENCE